MLTTTSEQATLILNGQPLQPLGEGRTTEDRSRSRPRPVEEVEGKEEDE